MRDAVIVEALFIRSAGYSAHLVSEIENMMRVQWFGIRDGSAISIAIAVLGRLLVKPGMLQQVACRVEDIDPRVEAGGLVLILSRLSEPDVERPAFFTETTTNM